MFTIQCGWIESEERLFCSSKSILLHCSRNFHSGFDVTRLHKRTMDNKVTCVFDILTLSQDHVIVLSYARLFDKSPSFVDPD